jgi:hypothetical protein
MGQPRTDPLSFYSCLSNLPFIPGWTGCFVYETFLGCGAFPPLSLVGGDAVSKKAKEAAGKRRTPKRSDQRSDFSMFRTL